MNSFTRVILQAGREQSVSGRHPWVFSGAIAKVAGEVREGGFVEVRDSAGSPICWGHYFPGNSIAVRAISFEKVNDEISAINIALQSAVELRRVLGLFSNSATTGFRLVHGEADSLPGLVVDIYARAIVMQCHSTAMYRLRHEIAECLKGLLLERIDTIYTMRVSPVVGRSANSRSVDPSLGDERPSREGSRVSKAENKAQGGKHSHKQHTSEADVEKETGLVGEYLYGSSSSTEFLENGMKFSSNWEKGQKTGFFLDQRNNRNLVRSLAFNRVVLDAFCYSGGFTISALSGGAKETHSVDASVGAIELVHNHLSLNGFGEQGHLYTADCFDFLTQMDKQFDMIILDPPAFVKHQKALQRGLRGYEAINHLAIERVKKGGLIFTYSCSQLVSKDEFRKRVFLAGVRAKRSVRVLAELEQAPCHPVSLFHREGAYLKGLLLYVE